MRLWESLRLAIRNLFVAVVARLFPGIDDESEE